MVRSERDEKIEKFKSQAQEGPRIFLLSAKVGGEGLNLTAATRVIIVDPSWNISDDNQIADRAFRIGQKEDVIIYRLFTCGTLEEDIYKTQMIKSNLAKAILEGKVSPPLVKVEDRKFIRLPECGFNSSETQQQLEAMVGDLLQMNARHQTFLRTHQLVAGLTNQEAVSSYDEISLIDLPRSESSDDEDSSSEGKKVAGISKWASRCEQEQQNARSLGGKVITHHGSKNKDGVSKHQEDVLTVTSQRIHIPANKIGVVIGQDGKTIRMIQTRSSAVVQTNPDKHRRGKFPDPCPIEILGTAKEIEKAKELIVDLVNKGDDGVSDIRQRHAGSGATTNGNLEICFSVPQDMVGLIIGSHGRRVRDIEEKSGARISQIKPESKFRIWGTLEAIDQAKELISAIMNKHTGSCTSSYNAGRQIMKQNHQAQELGESTDYRTPRSFYTPRATSRAMLPLGHPMHYTPPKATPGLSSAYSGERAHDHLYRPVVQWTMQPPPPQGMPFPCARSEYYGERGTGIMLRPTGNLEHQLEQFPGLGIQQRAQLLGPGLDDGGSRYSGRTSNQGMETHQQQRMLRSATKFNQGMETHQLLAPLPGSDIQAPPCSDNGGSTSNQRMEAHQQQRRLRSTSKFNGQASQR